MLKTNLTVHGNGGIDQVKSAELKIMRMERRKVLSLNTIPREKLL